MNHAEVIVEGNLEPDGTLSLDSKPNLPAGRVRVSLQKLSTEKPSEDWWQYMQRTRHELDMRGYPSLSDEQAQEYVDSLREDDNRIEEIYRQLEEERQRENKSGC